MSAQLEIAWEQADRGIRQSADHAEDVRPGWGAVALEALRCYAGFGYEFTSEQFRDYLKSIGLACEVPKALGSVFQKAARAGWLEKAGYAKSAQRHCSPCPIWRLRQVARAAA